MAPASNRPLRAHVSRGVTRRLACALACSAVLAPAACGGGEEEEAEPASGGAGKATPTATPEKEGGGNYG